MKITHPKKYLSRLKKNIAKKSKRDHWYQYLYDTDNLPFHTDLRKDSFLHLKGEHVGTHWLRYVSILTLIATEVFDIYVTAPELLDYILDYNTWAHYSLCISMILTSYFIINYQKAKDNELFHVIHHLFYTMSIVLNFICIVAFIVVWHKTERVRLPKY